MKNLATCKPSEFLKQTNRIKKAAEKWLTATDIMNIRKRMPDLITVTDEMPEAERKNALKQNYERKKAQNRENLSAMFDAIADAHPQETLDLLALMCFVEPEDVDDHPIDEYLTSISEMMGNEAVVGFFSSFRKWGLLNT